MLKLKALLAKILSWAGFKFDWSEYTTNNTTDTWVPVFRNEIIQHRVIPANYNRVPNVGSAEGTNSSLTRTGTGYTDLCSLSYTTNTGRFIVIARAVIKTSRYTSNALIRLDGNQAGYWSNTNSTSYMVVNPLLYTGSQTPGSTHTITLSITAQDSGTTCTSADYHKPWILVFDIP